MVIVAIVVVLEAPFFEAKNTQISGISRTSEGAILDALDQQPDTALLRYDTNAAAERVAQLPWIQQVQVSRSWPSTIRVVVRERTPVAAIGNTTGSRWMITSEDGMVVEERLTPPASVPIIIAADEVVRDAAVGFPLVGVERALEIADELPLQLAPWVTTWTSDSSGSVAANLVGSAVVEFGAFEDHRTQFVSLASILNGGAPLVCLELIDLSVADNPVLHRNGECMIASQELTS